MTTTDWIGIANIVATVAAIVAAPMIALRIAAKLQERSDSKKAKIALFSTLVSLRHDPTNADFLQALNLIDVVFVDDAAVREAWSRYYVVLNDGNMNNQAGFSIREDRKRELLLTIVGALRLREKISTADILRTYLPQFFGEVQFVDYYRRLLDLHKLQEELTERGIPHTPYNPVTGGATPPTRLPPPPGVPPPPGPPPPPPPPPAR
jgi:hypothetical protein